jgi:hypothetical protein
MIIKMNVENLAGWEDSVIVNFDGYQNAETDVTHHGGYVRISKDTDAFVVTIINSEGDVVSETEIPFNFVEADI